MNASESLVREPIVSQYFVDVIESVSVSEGCEYSESIARDLYIFMRGVNHKFIIQL